MESHEHEEIEHLRESDTQQWDAIDKLTNRLPLWATFMFGGLLSMVTGLIVRAFS
jgi:hypothetical protein